MATAVNVNSHVSSVAFSPCGKTMAVGCLNGKVVIVDFATVAVMRSWRGHWEDNPECICFEEEERWEDDPFMVTPTRPPNPFVVSRQGSYVA